MKSDTCWWNSVFFYTGSHAAPIWDRFRPKALQEKAPPLNKEAELERKASTYLICVGRHRRLPHHPFKEMLLKKHASTLYCTWLCGACLDRTKRKAHWTFKVFFPTKLDNLKKIATFDAYFVGSWPRALSFREPIHYGNKSFIMIKLYLFPKTFTKLKNYNHLQNKLYNVSCWWSQPLLDLWGNLRELIYKAFLASIAKVVLLINNLQQCSVEAIPISLPPSFLLLFLSYCALFARFTSFRQQASTELRQRKHTCRPPSLQLISGIRALRFDGPCKIFSRSQ